MSARTIKMRSISFALCLVSMMAASPARAENGCPYGYEPWRVPVVSVADCMPIPEYGYETPDDVPAQPRWVTRWGAIAIGDASSGDGLGVSSNQKSKKDAERAALSKCLTTGGGDACRSNIFSYHNQCAVVAWGTGSYVVRSGPVLDDVVTAAIRQCHDKTRECRLFYSDCSFPVPVR